MIERAMGTALQGIQTAQASAARAAERIAEFGVAQTEMVTPLVSLKLSSAQVEANAQVLKSEAQTHTALLDMLA